MRNFMKILLILVLCAGLLAMVGCKKQPEVDPAGTTGTTTVPEETTGDESPEETTTEKPVNIVEDPLNNGEGDPLDAIDGTTSDDGKPDIDIEIDDDAGSTGNGGSTGGNQGGSTGGNQGGSTGGNAGTTEPTQGGNTDTGDDDFVLDFGDLTGGNG